jgi:5-methyltetrahydrofolate--homocysteine methyltransferase
MVQHGRGVQMASLEAIGRAVIAGHKQEAVELTEAALSEGTAPMDVVVRGLIPGMEKVGERFQRNEFFVPNLIISARAMKAAMEIVRPLITEGEIAYKGCAVAGTIRGDLHDIGKNLVCMMMEGAGFEVHDLGVDVPTEQFVQAARDRDADLVLISALLTTTMTGVRDVIELLEREGMRERVKVLVGGAPITQAFAADVGADGFAADAGGAVVVAHRLLGEQDRS